MERKTVVIYKTTPPECYGSLQLFCDAKGLKYNTFSKKPLPFKFGEFEVHRVPFFSGAWGEKKRKHKPTYVETSDKL